MKRVDQLTLRLRRWKRTTSAHLRSRDGLARIVQPLFGPVPDPARLVLDLQAGWSSGAVERPLTPADWKDVITDVVEWLGPVPVTAILKGGAEDWCMRVVRYAHRLECPVTLETRGEGFDDAQCKQFLLAGVAKVRVDLDGKSLTPEREASTQSVVRFLETRKKLATQAEVVVRLHCDHETAAEIPALVGWALQVGVDGVEFVAPTHGPVGDVSLPAAAAERIARVEGGAGPACRTPAGTLEAIQAVWAEAADAPGASRQSSRDGARCPVGGLRVEVRADGSFGACPFQAPAGCWQKGTRLGELWEQGGEHHAAIAACDRVCQHPEYGGPTTGR